MPLKRKVQENLTNGDTSSPNKKLRKSARNKPTKQEALDDNGNIETKQKDKVLKAKDMKKAVIKLEKVDAKTTKNTKVRETRKKANGRNKNKDIQDSEDMMSKASKKKTVKQEKPNSEDEIVTSKIKIDKRKKKDELSESKPVKKIKEEPADEPSTSESKAPKKKRGSRKSIKEEPSDNPEPDSKPKKSNNKSEAPKKEAKERTLVKKGKAPVDGLCPIASTSHVFCDEDAIWDCMLNQTNIQFNNNKYYLIQLLQDDNKNSYSVWMRWGRVGADGQRCLKPCGGDLQKAKDIFTKKFSDKTRNEWMFREDFEKVPGKYDLLEMDYTEQQVEDTVDASVKKEQEEKKEIKSALENNVKELIELICDVKSMEQAVIEMKYDAKKAPLGKLTEAQVKSGYEALKRIDECIEQNSSNMTLCHACNDFYTRIPHYFGMKTPPLIRTKTQLKEKIQLLEALADIQAAMDVIGKTCDDGTHLTDQHYKGLSCDIDVLEKKSTTYEVLEKYLKSTHAKTHNMYNLEVLDIFSVSKGVETQRFNDVGNRMLLWHGSRLTNWAGILSQGLRIAPPEAPVTGYMFGKGIYFADMCSKSANYCMATNTNNVGILVLCDVALGKMRELTQADYKADKLPQGYHSVKGVGGTAFNPTNAEKLDDAVVPMGPCKKVADHRGALLYNEYIVYDPAQVKIKYLFKVKFNFKY